MTNKTNKKEQSQPNAESRSIIGNDIPCVEYNYLMEDISDNYGSMMGTEHYYAYAQDTLCPGVLTDGAHSMLAKNGLDAIISDILRGAHKACKRDGNELIAWRLCISKGMATLYAYGEPVPPDYEEDENLGTHNYENVPLPDGQVLMKTVINYDGNGRRVFVLCLALED